MADQNLLAQSRTNIRRALESRGLTSFEVSVALNKNRTYLDDYLRDRKKSITAEFMSKLSRYLNISGSYISGIEEFPEDQNNLVTYEQNVRDFQSRFELTQNEKKKLSDAQKGLQIADESEALRIQAEIDILQARLNLFTQDSDLSQTRLSTYPTKYNRTRSDWVIPNRVIEGQLGTVQENVSVYPVTDSAMSKEASTGLSVGDHVIIDRGRKDLRSGGIFLVREDASLFLRQVQLIDPGPPPKVMCKASNPDYPSFELTLGLKTELVGKVVGLVRLL